MCCLTFRFYLCYKPHNKLFFSCPASMALVEHRAGGHSSILGRGETYRRKLINVPLSDVSFSSFSFLFLRSIKTFFKNYFFPLYHQLSFKRFKSRSFVFLSTCKHFWYSSFHLVSFSFCLKGLLFNISYNSSSDEFFQFVCLKKPSSLP